tara:strand:- start:36 stop:236 length:201 start_codon:yes stop_codon:yes gene_type:complete
MNSINRIEEKVEYYAKMCSRFEGNETEAGMIALMHNKKRLQHYSINLASLKNFEIKNSLKSRNGRR